jgi:hypothetical protein
MSRKPKLDQWRSAHNYLRQCPLGGIPVVMAVHTFGGRSSPLAQAD